MIRTFCEVVDSRFPKEKTINEVLKRGVINFDEQITETTHPDIPVLRLDFELEANHELKTNWDLILNLVIEQECQFGLGKFQYQPVILYTQIMRDDIYNTGMH